jgi:hypothetical protein
MDLYTESWIFWGLMFAVIEGAALLNKKGGDTLSEHIWVWFSIKHKGRGWRLRRFALLAGLAWLILHFLTGGWV